MPQSETRFHNLSRKLALFTDPVRLRLFFHLFAAERDDVCVSDIAAFLKSSVSNTSHQLRKLELAGVVTPLRRGRMICYRVKKTENNKILYNCLNKLKHIA